jgi:hypothetical protein
VANVVAMILKEDALMVKIIHINLETLHMFLNQEDKEEGEGVLKEELEDLIDNLENKKDKSINNIKVKN